MRCIRLFYIFLLFSLCPLLSLGSNDIGGLLFRSYEYSKDERTSMIIPACNQQLRMKNYLSLSFQLKIKEKGEHFGYVCRMIIGNQKNINLTLVNPVNEDPYLCFIKDQQYLGKVPTSRPLDIYQWNTIRMEVTLQNDTLCVKGNGVVLLKEPGYPDDRSVRICFGANDFIPYSTSDVAPMVVKDILIGLSPGSEDYRWTLRDAVADTLLVDDHQRMKASVHNQDWVIDQHVHWQRMRTLTFQSKTFPVPDPANATIYFVSEDRVTTLNLLRNTTSERLCSPLVDVEHLTNQFIVLPSETGNGRLVCYDFEKPAKEILSFFDFETGIWSSSVARQRQSTSIQHSSFYSPADSSVVQLFGYGFHEYKHDLNRISLSGQVTKSKLTDIAPRYLSAVGVRDSLAYIYGGLGNNVGKQEYGVTGYRDLYILNLRDYTLRQQWSLPLQGNYEAAASTLVIDSAGRSAKGLFFSPGRFLSKMVMKELDLLTGEEETLGDTIPYTFLDVSSYADLLYIPSLGQYIAVTVHQVDGHHYEGNVYSIAAPVLPLSVYESKQESNGWWIALILAVIACLAGLFWGLRRRRARISITVEAVPESIAVPELSLTDQEMTPFSEKMATAALNITPGVYLLNGFQVINQHSEDITGKFTPIMRQLLSVIILYSCYNHKGISNVKLKELLWYDKSEESFSNNRSVNIRKIRLLLEEVGDAEVSSANGYWYFANKGGVYCDYLLAMQLMSNMSQQPTVANEEMDALLPLAAAGQLLPNMQFDWVDKFKADYSDSMIGLLSKLRDSKQFATDEKMKVILANCILRFDSLDEEAVRVKCRSLVELKRLGMAHAAFDSFVREYKLILNEDFKENFEQFICV